MINDHFIGDQFGRLVKRIKRLLESIEGQSEWLKDRSTASKLSEELSRF